MSGWFPKPAAAVERRIATDRLAINIVETGSGPAVLLLHGLGWDHSLWNPTIERFAPRYRIIAADTRGHGKTDKPDGPYDMEMFARDYAALADALGLKRICVIGLSQGGMVAQKLALIRPEARFGTCADLDVLQVRAFVARQHGSPHCGDGSGGAGSGGKDRGRKHLLAGLAFGEPGRTRAFLPMARRHADGAAQCRHPRAL